jgi:1-acyl-sn-glycerol-3-phosphate acyltransferase
MYLTIFAESLVLPFVKNNLEKFNKARTYFSSHIVSNAGISINTIGELDSDADLIVANHQSMLDVFTLEVAIGNDARFVGRTGIMDKWPVSVMVDLVGHITIDLSSSRSIVHLLKEVKSKKGLKVVIFPEGTRSQNGKIGEFESGAKILAQKLNLKVQPVVITNMDKVYNETIKFADPGTVNIEFMPVVDVEDGWYEKLHDSMQEKFLSYKKDS